MEWVGERATKVGVEVVSSKRPRVSGFDPARHSRQRPLLAEGIPREILGREIPSWVFRSSSPLSTRSDQRSWTGLSVRFRRDSHR